jgi:hypothetical protein
MIDLAVEAHEEIAAAPADHRTGRRRRFHDADILPHAGASASSMDIDDTATIAKRRDIMIV